MTDLYAMKNRDIFDGLLIQMSCILGFFFTKVLIGITSSEATHLC